MFYHRKNNPTFLLHKKTGPHTAYRLLNTLPEEMGAGCDKIKYLSVAPMFAEAIERIYQEISIAKLFS